MKGRDTQSTLRLCFLVFISKNGEPFIGGTETRELTEAKSFPAPQRVHLIFFPFK